MLVSEADSYSADYLSISVLRTAVWRKRCESWAVFGKSSELVS